MANATQHTELERETLGALREFAYYASCRQANAAERKMLAEHYARLGEKYAPILERLGLAPNQISQVEFDAWLAEPSA